MAKLDERKKWEDYDILELPDGTKIDMAKLLDEQARARTALVHLIPYFNEFISKFRFIYTFHVDTQATDGRDIFINPLFTSQLDFTGKVFVMAHEVMHCVLQHLRRMGDRDHEKSNIAADYECNITLATTNTSSGRPLVSYNAIKSLGAYIDKKYEGWGFEAIYKDCESSISKDKTQQPNQKHDKGNNQQDNGQGNNQGGSQGGQGQDNGLQDTGNQDSGQPGNGQRGSAPNGRGNNQGQGQGDQGDQGGSQGGGKVGKVKSSDMTKGGQGGSQGGQNPGQGGSQGGSTGQNGHSTGDGFGQGGQGNGKTGNVTPGDMTTGSAPDGSLPGAMVDGRTGDEIAEKEGYGKNSKSQESAVGEWASDVQKSIGNAPGNLRSKLQQIFNTNTDWKKILQKIVGRSINTTATRSAFANKNVLAAQGRIARTEKDKYDTVDFIMCCIDTSGSMTEKTLQLVLSEVYTMAVKKKPISLAIVMCDVQIQDIIIYNNLNEFKRNIRNIHVKGGGGTELKPCWDLLREDPRFKKRNCELMMVFTDGYLNQYKRDRKTQNNLCWCVVDNPSFDLKYKDTNTYLVHLDTKNIK